MSDVTVRVYVWYCGDECDCSQAVVKWFGPNKVAPRVWYQGTIDEGNYYCEGERPSIEEVRALAAKHTIPFDEETLSGERPATDEERALYEHYADWHKDWLSRGAPFAERYKPLLRRVEALDG